MKVLISLSLEVSSFEGFGSKSLVYDEVFDELCKVTKFDDCPLGEQLVCPDNLIILNLEISK